MPERTARACRTDDQLTETRTNTSSASSTTTTTTLLSTPNTTITLTPTITTALTGATASEASSQTPRSRRDDMNTQSPNRPSLSWSSSFSCAVATRTTSESILPTSAKRGSTEAEHTPPKTSRVTTPHPPHKMARTASFPTMESYTCPDNFAVVTSSVYRSSFPRPEHFSYIKKLGLKTILTLVPEPYPEENIKFMKENGITHYQIGMPGNNKGNPLADPQVPDDKITRALSIILNKANHPILIHCNKGKHRTGCVVGCLRRFQGWTVPLAIEEYRKYASIKSRQRDMAKIENYSLQHCWDIAKENDWIPTTLTLEEEMETEPPLLTAAPAAIKAQ